MKRRTAAILSALVASLVTLAIVSAPAFAAVYKDISEFRFVRKTNTAATVGADYSASGDIYKITLQAQQIFRVNTVAGAVDLDFGEDALDAADVGAEWLFVVEAGGTNALTVTAGTGVATVKALATLGSTCEDVGDTIRVIAYSTTQASAITACAD